MSGGFKQTGLTQQITTTGAWLANALSTGTFCGAVRVHNNGNVEAQVVMADTQASAQPSAVLADGVPSNVMTIPPNSDQVFGPYQGAMWFNAVCLSGPPAGTFPVLRFTPGSGGTT